jgi:DNA-binding transcriptional MerR regulator
MLTNYKNIEPVTIDELVSLLGELLPQLVGEQERYKVTSVPTVRTIRHYISKGLVDKPLRYEGPAALYGYRHLLQIVVIKHLQANHFQIKKIGEIITGLSDEELEELLLPPEMYEKRKKPTDMATPLLMGILKSKLKDDLPKPTAEDTEPGPPAVAKISEPKPLPSWRRIEIEPGFEIHLREDYQKKEGSEIDVLLSKIKHLLRKQMEDKGGF